MLEIAGRSPAGSAGAAAGAGWSRRASTEENDEGRGNLFETWSLDREIVLVRLLNHPRDKIFAAWMGRRSWQAGMTALARSKGQRFA
nr:hypothetical protein [uncultured bacterium]